MRGAAIGVLGVILGSVMPVAQDPSQQPVFRAGTYGVSIDVSVRRGKTPVPGLTARDFELLDNGVRQAVDVQGNAASPLDISLVLDHSYQFQTLASRRLAGDLAKTAASLGPSDRLRVITFAADVREVLPMQTLSRVLPGGSTFEPLVTLLKPDWPKARELDLRSYPRLRRWALFDAVLLALARPVENGRRHLIIVIGGGVDSGSVLADGATLQAAAARTEGLLHVALGPTEGYALYPRLPVEYGRSAITAAAAATGGDVHTSNLVGAFRTILEDFRRGYFLRYTLTGVPAGGWHDVVVTTPGLPKAVVRARKAYAGR